MPRHIGLAAEPDVVAPPGAIIVRVDGSVSVPRGRRRKVHRFPNLWAAHKAAEQWAAAEGRPLWIQGLAPRATRPANHYHTAGRRSDLHWLPDAEE